MKATLLSALASAVLAAGVATGVTAALAAPASHAPAVKHYSRNETFVISTRRNGTWYGHCHNVKIVVHDPITDYLFGGCLPPKHVG